MSGLISLDTGIGGGRSAEPAPYQLICCACGRRRSDDGLTLGCPQPHEPALWRTEYQDSKFEPDSGCAGLFRYHGWLPVRRAFDGVGGPVAYRSQALAASLGLSELWIAFNGYWPERGAALTTGSFKELEAATVLGRLPDEAERLVVASAGNTGAAFAELCGRYEIPVVIVVPESALPRLRTRAEPGDSVRIIAVEGADYGDAIAFADALAAMPGFVSEGGTKNVGRRDGLGTVMLAGYEAMGGLPDYYVQAIGSGAGAIAAHEAAVRLRRHADTAHGRRAETALPRMLLAQNDVFAPVYEAWQQGRRPWLTGSEHEQRLDAAQSFAPELTNRKPPYDVRGGLCDALTESAGRVTTVSAPSARAAMAAFLELEGIDIEPPAGVAVGALQRAVRAGRLDPAARILLNVTGGGKARLAAGRALILHEPAMTVSREEIHHPERIAEAAEAVAAGAARQASAS